MEGFSIFKNAKPFDIAVEICIIFLIIFTPLAFGCVGLGPQIVLISICEIIFLLWLANAAKAGWPDFKSNIFIYLFVVFFALMIFQFLPLPKFLLKILSPTTYKNYVEFLPGYKERFTWRSISIYPAVTKIELFKIVPYGLVSWVIVNSFNKKKQILRFLTSISVTGFAVALFGIIQRFTWNGMIYWIQSIPENAGPFGPFVNKNHFAGFMELTIPITAAFIFISQKIEKKVLFGFMAIVMLLALFLSLSRAGILSFFSATAFLFLIIFLRRHFKKYLFYILPSALLIFIAIFFIAKDPLVERFSTVPDAIQNRWQLYKDIFRMFLDFPVFGAGTGNFSKIFPMYKTIAGGVTFSHADSDWMQFLTETGLLGFLCIGIFIWLFFKDILYCHFLGKGHCVLSKDINLRHDRFILLVISAGTVSIASIILHGMVDVNLHIPSNMLLACVIGALLVTVAHTKFKEDDNR